MNDYTRISDRKYATATGKYMYVYDKWDMSKTITSWNDCSLLETIMMIPSFSYMQKEWRHRPFALLIKQISLRYSSKETIEKNLSIDNRISMLITAYYWYNRLSSVYLQESTKGRLIIPHISVAIQTDDLCTNQLDQNNNNNN